MCVSQDRSFWDRTVCGTCKFMYMTFQMWVACTQWGVGVACINGDHEPITACKL